MAEEALDGLEVVVGEEQVAGEGVTEGMRGNALGDGGLGGGVFDGSLDVGLMEVIAAVLAKGRNEGECGGREEPLPYEFFGGVLVLLLELARQERARKVCGKVLSMEAANEVELLADFGQGAGGERDGAVLLAFAVVDGEEHGVEVEAVDAEVDALGEAQAAAVEQESGEVIRGLQVAQHGFEFGPGEDNGDVAVAFGANDTIELAEFPAQHMAVEEEEGVKCLVLGGGGDAVAHRQLGEEPADLIAA